MPRIVINHNNSLEVNGDNELCVKMSNASGSSLTLRSDGLYAQQKAGTSGAGYPDGYKSNNGLVVGIESPMGDNPYELPHSKRVVLPNFVHRIFTCTQTDGSDISIRQCDVILPGDMYRVLDNTDPSNPVYNYYIILKSNGTTATVVTPNPVATVPANASYN